MAPFPPRCSSARERGCESSGFPAERSERCWHRALREEASCQNSPHTPAELANLRGHRVDHLSAEALEKTEGCEQDTKQRRVGIRPSQDHRSDSPLQSTASLLRAGKDSGFHTAQGNACSKGKAAEMTKQNPYEADHRKQLPYSSLSRPQSRSFAWLT